MSTDPCRSRSMVIAAALAAAIAGCSRGGQARLDLEPHVASACNQPIATTVRWDVRALGLKRVQIEVNNLGRKPKLWMDGEAVGTARSGPWAHDGYTVTLKAMNGVVLARRTLTTTPCPGMSWL